MPVNGFGPFGKCQEQKGSGRKGKMKHLGLSSDGTEQLMLPGVYLHTTAGPFACYYSHYTRRMRRCKSVNTGQVHWEQARIRNLPGNSDPPRAGSLWEQVCSLKTSLS